MTTLRDAIRTRIEDNQLTAREIGYLLQTAAKEGGFQTSEMREILRAIDSTETGFNPRVRAQLLVQLSDMGYNAQSALGEVRRRPVNWSETERLTEICATVEFLIDGTNRTRNNISNLGWSIRRLTDEAARAEGRFSPDSDVGLDMDEYREKLSDLRSAHREASSALDRFRSALEAIPLEHRQLAFASMDSSMNRAWNQLNDPLDDYLLIGASDSQRQSLTGPLPSTGLEPPEGGSERVAGIEFAGPTEWAYSGNRFTFPEGTQITTWPAAGSFTVSGSGVSLPTGHVLEAGSIRFEDGNITIDRGATVSVGGVPVTATDSDAQARGSNSTLIAGPHFQVNLPALDAQGFSAEDRDKLAAAEQAAAEAKEAGVEASPEALYPEGRPEARELVQRQIRFTANEGIMPENVDIRRGTGSMTVLFDGDEAVGVLEGSVRTDPGAYLYTRHAGYGADPEPLVDRVGERGELSRSAAVYRDGALIGLLSGARAKLDGIDVSVALGEEEFATYRFDAPNTYVFGGGSTVHSTPEEGTFNITGENVRVAVGDRRLRIVSGGVLSTNGVITHIMPNSVVELTRGILRTSREAKPVEILDVAPSVVALDSNQVFFGPDQIVAQGSGFTVGAYTSSQLLGAGEDPIFIGREQRNELTLNGGRIEIGSLPAGLNRPDGIRAHGIAGDVDIVSGPIKLNTTRPDAARVDRAGFGGPIMHVELGDETYEIDPRAMYSTYDPATDTGRVRRLQPIYSERFGGADRAFASSIVEGKVTVGLETEAAPKSFVRNVQATLSYYLDRPIDLDGELDAQTVGAIRSFQRFVALEPTGVIDSDTMQLLDANAPEPNRPMVMRIENGPLGGEIGLQVSGIIAGTSPSIRDPGRGAPTPRGPLIQAVQRIVGTSADGMMGPGTARAVRDWQSRYGVATTGRIDAATLQKMLETTGTRTSMTIQPREKLMVMVAMNDEVPDELRRFRELAARRGARSVIIGPDYEPLQDGRELTRYLAMAQTGAVDFDWLVISGHSTGRSTWGKLGRFEYSWFPDWREQFPAAFAQIEKLSLLNCYNVTPERARNFWPGVFDNLQAAAGFMYSAPGVESQTSDEFLLNSGTIMLALDKGEAAKSYEAQQMAREFERDDFIMWQNAALFVRTGDNADGVFGMTNTARREMTLHGAEEELRSIPERFTEAFDNYMEAATPEFAEPPHGHDSILRQYLGAVQHIVDRWEGRMQAYERFQRQEAEYLASHRARYVSMNGSEAGYRTPNSDDYPASLRSAAEEYGRTRGWEDEYAGVQKLRARILNLVKADAIQNQFGAFHAAQIDAFNTLLEEQYAELNAAREARGEEPVELTLLPNADEWGQLNRMEMRQRIRDVDDTLSRIDYDVRRQDGTTEDWVIMVDRDPTELEFTSPDKFFRRIKAFVDRLDPTYIQPEWLDGSLMREDLRRIAAARPRFVETAARRAAQAEAAARDGGAVADAAAAEAARAAAAVPVGLIPGY